MNFTSRRPSSTQVEGFPSFVFRTHSPSCCRYLFLALSANVPPDADDSHEAAEIGVFLFDAYTLTLHAQGYIAESSFDQAAEQVTAATTLLLLQQQNMLHNK